MRRLTPGVWLEGDRLVVHPGNNGNRYSFPLQADASFEECESYGALVYVRFEDSRVVRLSINGKWRHDLMWQANLLLKQRAEEPVKKNLTRLQRAIDFWCREKEDAT